MPKEYRRLAGRIRSLKYRVTENPLDLLNALCAGYGTLTPTERDSMETQWLATWNTQVPIESYFASLEDLYQMTVAHPPPYTLEQMMGSSTTVNRTYAVQKNVRTVSHGVRLTEASRQPVRHRAQNSQKLL